MSNYYKNDKKQTSRKFLADDEAFEDEEFNLGLDEVPSGRVELAVKTLQMVHVQRHDAEQSGLEK